MYKLAHLAQQQLKYDAPYAWFLRNQASMSPLFRYQHLAELDSHLNAYLTCFQSSHIEQQSLIKKINSSDWGAVYIFASLSLQENNRWNFDNIVNTLKEQQQSKELSDALCRVDYNKATEFINYLLSHRNPLARIAAVTAYGFFNDDINNSFLLPFLQDVPSVVVAALKMIGVNKRVSYTKRVVQLLTHDDESIRFQAVFSGSLLGLPKAISVLQDFCYKETVFLRDALSLLYHVIDDSDITSCVTRIQNSSFSPRIKAYNLAMAGLPDNIPILLEWMNDPEYAPIAGEAFSFITGVDIEEDDLSLLNVELCESREAPLAEKRKSDPWTQGYEDDLPWPDPSLVLEWWQKNQHQFQKGRRYLAGYLLNNENLQRVLKQGTQTQRHTASLILATKNPDDKVFDVTGFQ